MRSVIICLIAAAVLAVATMSRSASEGSSLEGMPEPQYDEAGELILPTGFRSWVFVGASLGLSYSENVRREGPGQFHNVYMQPQAYAHYEATGKFPEKTMLVMTNHAAVQKESINLHGHFEGKQTGLEVALKDRETYEDGWAYFNFSTRDGLKPTSKAFGKKLCYDCHSQHGADDNVFTQFYPILRRLKESAESETKEKESEKYEAEGE
jgi:hypothetical protein